MKPKTSMKLNLEYAVLSIVPATRIYVSINMDMKLTLEKCMNNLAGRGGGGGGYEYEDTPTLCLENRLDINSTVHTILFHVAFNTSNELEPQKYAGHK